MKMNLKAVDFADKENLEKTLDTKLKKPLMALADKKKELTLPFCYEADYFGEGRGFMSIGFAKEITKLFKTKRTKGQGTDASGKPIKIDKKKVAYGMVKLNAAGEFEFQVISGTMKQMEAKTVIKSIAVLKKEIGDNFIITKGAVETEIEGETEEGDSNEEEGKGESISENDAETKKVDPEIVQANIKAQWQMKKQLIKDNMRQMKKQLENLNAKLA